MGYYVHSELEEGPLMKKIIFIMLLILVGVGAFFAWKMLKGRRNTASCNFAMRRWTNCPGLASAATAGRFMVRTR